MEVEKFETYRPAAGGGDIFTRIWLPGQGEPLRALVQIAHGVAEHGGRYGELAGFLAGHGYGVYAQDHMGHGKSVQNGIYGHFGDQDGWENVIQDMKNLSAIMRKKYPELPLLLVGHSMGSILTRCYIARGSSELAGAALIGPPGPNPMAGVGMRLAKRYCGKKGAAQPGRELQHLIFGSYNRRIDGPRSGNDWLTRDAAVVAAFDGDSECGFPLTNRGYYDMFTGMREVSSPKWAGQVRKTLPILILAGEEDPVGNYGKGPRKVAKTLTDAGVQDVGLKLYPGGRHEIFNELNRQEVFGDLLQWMEKCICAERGGIV